MSQECCFSSVNDAIQYLSNITNSRIVISKLTPSKEDYVILLNPRTDLFHVYKYPGDNIREFSKQDIVKDMRAKGKKGEPLTFPSSMDLNKVAKEIANMAAGLSVEQRRKLNAEDMRGIFFGDSLASDRSTDISDVGKVDFVTDRNYSAYGDVGKLSTKEDLIKQKEKEIKRIKKAPTRYKKKVVEKEIDPLEMHKHTDFSKEELQKMFSSSDEAIQHLANITGKKVIIK